jgi:hypothetical protein
MRVGSNRTPGKVVAGGRQGEEEWDPPAVGRHRIQYTVRSSCEKQRDPDSRAHAPIERPEGEPHQNRSQPRCEKRGMGDASVGQPRCIADGPDIPGVVEVRNRAAQGSEPPDPLWHRSRKGNARHRGAGEGVREQEGQLVTAPA